MRKLLTCRFFVAVIAFGALTIAAGASSYCHTKPLEFPYRSWTAWAIEDFFKQQKTPDVVFMGSSLVLVPLCGVDADTLNRRLDATEHHRCNYFEQKLAEKTGIKTETYNFALPGEMPSDACLISSFLLKPPHTPKLLVYGVGPRDFMDNLLPSPASTDPYKFLSRFGDVDQWSSLLMPGWTERVNYELGKLVYLYGTRTDIADQWATKAANALRPVMPVPTDPNRFSEEERQKLNPDFHPFELKRNQAFFRPSSKEELATFVDNIGEYRKRYKKLKLETFMAQMHFFKKTLEAARKNGAQVVVAAMPITDINRELISDHSWNAYKTSIRTIAQAEGASFLDFNQDTDFVRSDFGDTVHLHSVGGRKWLDKLVDKIKNEQKVIGALKGTTGLAGNGGSL